jgi:hypothetical protein
VALTEVQTSASLAFAASGSAASALPANVTAGNGVGVVVFGTADTTAFSAASGFGISTWARGGGISTVLGLETEIWTGFGSTGGSLSLTMTGQAWEAIATEFAGGASASTFTSASGTSSAPAISLTPATGDVVLCGAHPPASTPTISSSPSSPWVSNPYNHAGSTYQIASSGSSLTATWGLSASGAWNAVGMLILPITIPTVTGISPTSGNLGPDPITITGTNFITGATVAVGGTAATSVVVVNGTTITCNVPAKAAATYDVVVTTLGGTSATSGSDHYTYLGGSATLAEGAAATGVLSRIRTQFRTLTEGAAAADSVTMARSKSRTFAEGAAAAETLVVRTKLRTFAEGALATAVLGRLIREAWTLAEGAAAAETLGRLRNQRRTLTEGALATAALVVIVARAPVGQLPITYYLFDLTQTATWPAVLAVLPFAGVKLGRVLNGAGAFSGTLNLRDPGVSKMNALNGTRPGRTLLIADIGGQIAWGGILWTRSSPSDTGILSVTGQELWSWFDHKVQTFDYTFPLSTGTYWNANPADAAHIAAQIVSDVLAGFSNLGPVPTVVINGSNTANLITASFPGTQLQMAAGIVAQLAATAYSVGFDFTIEWVWSGLPGSTPVATLNFWWPRAGALGSASSPVVDVSQATKYVWSEDATSQADTLYATGSSGAQLKNGGVYDATPSSAGYQHFDAVVSYTSIISSSTLSAAADDELAGIEWPVAVPVVTMPAFPTNGGLQFGSFHLGDDLRTIFQPDERFPSGIDTYMRAIGVDLTIGDDGESTMDITFNMPPSALPATQPPI